MMMMMMMRCVRDLVNRVLTDVDEQTRGVDQVATLGSRSAAGGHCARGPGFCQCSASIICSHHHRHCLARQSLLSVD